MIELLITQLQEQCFGSNSLKGQGESLWKAIFYTLKQCSIYGTVYSTARIHEYWNREVEMGVFIITPSE